MNSRRDAIVGGGVGVLLFLVFLGFVVALGEMIDDGNRQHLTPSQPLAVPVSVTVTKEDLRIRNLPQDTMPKLERSWDEHAYTFSSSETSSTLAVMCLKCGRCGSASDIHICPNPEILVVTVICSTCGGMIPKTKFCGGH